MARKPLDKDIKRLYGLSAGCCNICKKQLFENDVHFGEMAHIIAHSSEKNAPRSNGCGGDNSYDNLILLCPNCHTQVDQDPSSYSVEDLHKFKCEHENSIRNSLQADNGKDRYLLNIINQHINLQYILSCLRHSTVYKIHHDVINIGDMIRYLEDLFCPQYYPFDDSNLTKIMNEIISAYENLYCKIRTIYELKNDGYLGLISHVKLSYEEIEIIQQSLDDLTKAIFSFLDYQRETFGI